MGFRAWGLGFGVKGFRLRALAPMVGTQGGLQYGSPTSFLNGPDVWPLNLHRVYNGYTRCLLFRHMLRDRVTTQRLMTKL